MNVTDEILSYLEDEESRFIYQKRVEYSETKNFDYIKEIVSRYVPQLTLYYPGIVIEMLDRIKDKEKIIVFGSGVNGREVLDLLMSHGIVVESLVDNNSSKWGQYIEGIEIKCPQEIDYNNIDVVIITPSEQAFVDQIHRQMKALGIKKDILMIDYNEYLPQMLVCDQYFDPDIIKLQEEEVFVDAGVLDLNTSIRFAKECEKNEIKRFKILAFEPDHISYQKCLDLQKQIMNIDLQLYNAGLWSENATLYFSENGNGGSCITQKQTSISIKAVSLDECVLDRVTFIKMDIEGAELEALKGAKKIIKKYKPKLAICIYHKKQDLTEIPQYIKELVPEYRMYIRHYSNTVYETVLYAVI